MKKLAYGILALVVLLIVAVIAVPFLVPAERIKTELMIAANDATGRTLSIDGDLGVSVFPVLGLTASKVSFSNAPTSETANMATIENLVIELNLIPLLSGQVSVDKFILDTPVIVLEVDKNGKKNWEFETAKTAPAPTESSESGSPTDLGISDLNLGDVQIKNGSFTYNDMQAGASHQVSEANLALELNGLDSPFKTNGSAVWKGEKIELDTELGSLRAVLENKATTAKLGVNSTKVTLSFDGNITTLTPLNVGGATELNVPSLKGLVAWAAEPMDAKEGTMEQVLIKGTVAAKGDTYSFTGAELTFDKINATGDFSANIGGKVPSLKGQLNLPVLDINPYMPDDGASETQTAAAPQKSGEKWDDTPIDFSALKSVNADFKLTVGELLVQKMKIGQTSLAALLKDGVLKLDLNELALYEGKGKGSVTVNAQGSTAKITESFALEGLQLQPFLKDAADFDKLEGTGNIDLSVTTTGVSQKSFVENLNGKGGILFTDGAINGINLAAMARNVTSAFTDSGEAQKTDFAELSGTYTIVNGLLDNKDLKMLNPFVQVTGAGTVNMPPKTLDYRLEPKLTASAEGQGSSGASGIAVPINVTGSWEDPSFAPDLAGMISNVADPKVLKEKLEAAGKEKIEEKVKESVTKDLGGKLKGLLK